MPDIVDIAANTEGFSTLVAAVKAAGLVEVLKGSGPFTVFAPTDEAFSKLPPGTVQTLVQNPPQLARILKYHVVSGKLKQADLVGRDRLVSVEGSEIGLDLSDGFEVKNATVVIPDIEADNGVIHVIDGVILMG
ncbi:fasciclin-like repeat-containing secreted and surface protein [Rubidibacter lacunae KORDI 51-2]|uniref:Fasciclin-like repeat-containing secreted and surface protein n=1 Tax=Rubidibacter lacunae KORDI 51-2 TaxID=582515 RepID=U5DMW0_9CHRO|nr:fasciclin domain-containing protein [Rubidibacter lacunae]ERN42177.1 fasciclin-like repeat-containing secreted and surface protein [Rubidibacter lacunae KORDI 51-2]